MDRRRQGRSWGSPSLFPLPTPPVSVRSWPADALACGGWCCGPAG
jgi:hypothetical protein